MDTHRFFVEKIRFHLTEEDTIVFVGWFYDGSTKNHTLTARFDGRELPVVKLLNKGVEVRQKYIRSVNEIDEEVVGIVKLPENWKSGRRLSLHSTFLGESRTDAVFSVRKLYKLQNEIHYYIENCHKEQGKVSVSGWSMGGGEIKLSLLDAKKQPLSVKTDHYYRKDLLSIYPECEKDAKPGFLVQTDHVEKTEQSFYLEMRGANSYLRIRLKKWDDGTRLQYLSEKAGDTARYFARNGFFATLQKIRGKLAKKEAGTYEAWLKKYGVTPEELQKQKNTNWNVQPFFSVVVPLYQTNPVHLREMIASVLEQTYTNLELCLADGSGGTEDNKAKDVECRLTEIVEEFQKKDKRVKYRKLERNLGIAENTNAAMEMAEGDYIVFVDHDDLLAPNALYEFAGEIEKEPEVDVLYSDEDKVDMDGKKYFEPHFKPDYNLDLLCSVNYICHLFAVRKELLCRVGGFRNEYEGAQDYDFILRCCEEARIIGHVEKILYHWRCHMDSTAARPESKLYAFEAGRRAVEAHYRRKNIPAVVENAQFYGMYRTRYRWESEPLVSIIIPNKDHVEDLSKCLHSICGQSDYRNFEIIIVENNSTEQETFSYYREISRDYDNIHVIVYKEGFNFSKINNYGVRAAKGEYLLLLNNDTEWIGSGGIREMLGVCMRKDVGAVGAKLLYADGTIQHAGIILGFGGTAGHAFLGKSRYDTGYFGRILCTQDYSAVTAACLMTKKSVYEEVGGMTEELAVAFNDVDFCLKIRKTGRLVVYDPYAELYHYESKSRGYEDSPSKVERFNDEIGRLLEDWRTWIEAGDPYYNRNLTLDNSDFSLKR